MKKLFMIVIVGFILLIAAETNPPKEKFVTWAKEQIKGGTNNTLVNFGVKIIGGAIINSTTTSQNYVFFSIYDTNISGHEMKVIGVFNNFIPLNKSSNKNYQ